MQKVFVTGVAGFIGSSLVDRLPAGATVTGCKPGFSIGPDPGKTLRWLVANRRV